MRALVLAALGAAEWSSRLRLLWPTYIESINITTDLDGGFEQPTIHYKIAEETTRRWRKFQSTYRGPLAELNNQFFSWQRRVFEERGDEKKALKPPTGDISPKPWENSTWREMQSIAEYPRLRVLVQALSERFLLRTGIRPGLLKERVYSLFNWFAVHQVGESHSPHTHLGEYHVGVYYAQATPRSGKILFTDPRG